MQENKLDVVVRLHSSLPPGQDRHGAGSRRPRATRAARAPIGPNAGLTEVLIPAGYVREVYDPVFVLSADKTRYIADQQQHADDGAGARPAVLAGVPGRPGQGGPDPQGGVGLPGRVEAARAAAGVRPARQGAAAPDRRDAEPGRCAVSRRINRRSVATMVVSGAGVGMVAALAVLAGPAAPNAQVATWRFQLEEATIDDVHRAIKEGQITCQGLVQAYLNRARAYNGIASKLVTEEMAPQYLPDYDQYKAAVAATAALQDGDPKKTPPIEFGRMEPTASDPAVQQQYGMVVGIPNAGQLRAHGHAQRARRALGHVQGRSRSPPVEGAAAGRVRRPSARSCASMPDALERAAELDAQYGRNPDLAAMPMYCIPFSFKDPFDTKDMRSTGGGDTRYDIDFPARDQTLVAQLRAKGAIIYAKANTTEYNGRGGNPGGDALPDQGAAVDARLPAQHLGRQPVQRLRHDTRRVDRLELGLGRLGRRQPRDVQPVRGDRRSRAAVRPTTTRSALILPHKSLISFHGGAIGAEHLPGPRRHRLPQRRRFGQGARRAQGSRQRLLRSARHLHHRAALERPRRAYAKHVTPGTRRLAEGDAHRHHPRVHGHARQGRRADRRGRGRRR